MNHSVHPSTQTGAGVISCSKSVVSCGGGGAGVVVVVVKLPPEMTQI